MYPTGISKLNNIVIELKNSLKELNIRLEETEERIRVQGQAIGDDLV